MSATLLSAPSLPTFANKKPNDTEGGYRVHPPCTYGKLHNESCDHDKGKPAAGDALGCISFECATAECLRKAKLTAGKEIHYRNGEYA
jgi:hypothetical protein